MALKEKKRELITGFNLSEKQCVWMRAKVVATKYCDNAFDCTTCNFDKGMAKKMEREAVNGSWSLKVLDLPTDQQRCRHAFTGRAPANKLCCRSYQCGDCPFDQMLDEMIQVDHTILGPPQYVDAAGYRVPRDYYIHKTHAWARVEYGGRVRVGLDDFGARLIGRVEAYRLPSVGARITAGAVAFVVQRDSNEVEVKSSVSGIVAAVNNKLSDNPGYGSEDPYGEGWAVLLDPTDLKTDLKELLFGLESLGFMESEIGRLAAIIGDSEPKGPLADVYGTYKQIGWDKLVKSFL
ncbi:MAG: hypothetical protein V2B18_02700 [Pseudomonadota bacterium]